MSNYVALLRSLTAVTAVSSASLREAQNQQNIHEFFSEMEDRQPRWQFIAETACVQ